MSLFYDWLFFNPSSETVMNIEPGILLMVHSVGKYSDVTLSCLDFLVQIPKSYKDFVQPLVYAGITNSFKKVLQVQVIQ
jgi:integrator complex subunit 3